MRALPVPRASAGIGALLRAIARVQEDEYGRSLYEAPLRDTRRRTSMFNPAARIDPAMVEDRRLFYPSDIYRAVDAAFPKGGRDSMQPGRGRIIDPYRIDPADHELRRRDPIGNNIDTGWIQSAPTGLAGSHDTDVVGWYQHNGVGGRRVYPRPDRYSVDRVGDAGPTADTPFGSISLDLQMLGWYMSDVARLLRKRVPAPRKYGPPAPKRDPFQPFTPKPAVRRPRPLSTHPAVAAQRATQRDALQTKRANPHRGGSLQKPLR